MPYSGIDDEKLPDAVKKLDDKLRGAWVKSWNATFSNCEKQKGEDCESRAFAIANSVVKRMAGGDDEMSFLQPDELSADSLTDGREFDGLACGEFTDMHGRNVKFAQAELGDYLSNTLAAIEATRGESGELAGLPIDARGHEKGDGAGWIVGARVDGEKVRLMPRWTEIGRELIGKGIRRFFSATVDTVNKVILGGTLTNWPATRDKSGRVLLRPVELSQKLEDTIMTELTKDQLNELVDQRVAEQAKVKPPEQKPVDLAAALPPETRSALMLELRKQAELEWRAEMERVQHETKMAELSAELTKGGPRGLRVAPDELKAHLSKMQSDESKFWVDLLKVALKDGFVEFEEVGHGKNIGGKQALPADYAAALDAGKFQVADLSSPVLGLGDLAQYDLSKWQGGK